jgi:hypothetical protein
MTSSSEEVVDNKPVLSFIVIVAAIVGSFYVGRKFLGTIPALIISYLMYVYRNDISKGFEEMLQHGRRES